jgi:hypothetical protein
MLRRGAFGELIAVKFGVMEGGGVVALGATPCYS